MGSGWLGHALGVRESGMRPVTRWVAGAAIALSLMAFASDTRVGPVTNAQAAGTTAAPLHTFGYAHGTVSDLALTDMRHYLDAIAKITGPGGVVRAPIHWDPYQSSGPNWKRYDLFLDELRARDLVFVPEIHTSHDGHYVIPGQAPGGWADWQADIRAIVAHYGPGGIYADAHPGFDGMTRYEIWNEPNTPTGNATVNHDGSVDMDPQLSAEILRTGSEAVRQQAAVEGFTPEVIGPALGSIDLAYLNRMLGADPHLLSYVDTVSVHVYMRLDPNTCPIGEVRCIRTLLSLRSLIDANGGSAAGIAITEGGYSGSNDATRPNNVVTEALQASWGKGAIDWMRARPELKVNLYTPYNPLDKGVSYSGDDYSYWHDHLGAVRASDLAFKPWGLTYHNLVAQYSLQQTVDTEPPSVPANLNGASPVASAPKLTWDASTDNVGVTGYQVLRDGKQVASVTGTSYTDSVSAQGTYTYTVRALDAAGNTSAVSAPATIVLSDTTAPSVPAGLTAASPTAKSPVLSWSTSSDPDDPVAGYIVFRDGVQVGTTTATTFTDVGAAYGGTYAYAVAAKDTHGNVSAQSGARSVVYTDSTAPSKPTGLSGTTPTGSSPKITWSASVDIDDPVAGYLVFRAGVQIASTTGTSFTDTTAAPGGSHSYTVAARDSHGNQSAQSDPLVITYKDATPPTAPTDLAGVTPTTTAPALTWAPSTDPDDPVAGYRVYRDGKQVGKTTTAAFTDSRLAKPNATLLSDRFSRSLKSWGSAPSGGSYDYNTGGAGFWTNGAQGVMQLAGTTRALQAGLPESTALSVDMRSSFLMTKRPAGGSVRLMLIARARGLAVGADSYRAVVAVAPSGTITYGARKLVGGKSITLGSTPTAPFSFASNQRYNVRFQVTGTSPTVIRVKLWRDGTTEPAMWGVVTPDGSTRLQSAGVIAVRTVVGRRVSNKPLTTLVDAIDARNLSPSEQHVYTVRAEDTYGNLSPLSAPFTIVVR
jgi:chitodextrinase